MRVDINTPVCPWHTGTSLAFIIVTNMIDGAGFQMTQNLNLFNRKYKSPKLRENWTEVTY